MSRSLSFLLLLIGFQAANAGPWYMDATYSRSKGDMPDTPVRPAKNRDDGWQLTGGYQFSPYLSFEFSYVDLGEQTSGLNGAPLGITNPDIDPDNFGTWYNPFTTSTGQTAAAGFIAAPAPSTTIETRGIRLAAVGGLPLGDIFSLNLQGGVLVPEYQVTRNSFVLQPTGDGPYQVVATSNTEESNDPEIFLGLGTTAQLTDTIGLKLFWEKYLDMGNKDTFEQDLDTYNLALRFSF